ncbi:MAG TPA: cobalamin biosynthesis protein CobM [Methanothermobacter sp.]|uniref:Cobalamin biosynthesis protein CobM n=1 Tax=Methanothermobacter tenebrarum TaxID=680118 RepID=A0ABM7YBT0_9EURY|nr:energy-coupling factor ABC transporter permease [Methanothermobacter tenebrarum]MDD3455132.1 energy-coupling factor ABC transporter permease [Methanobacteriales archaeon]MDI6882449.1 energy-coupling factor ABC transporter permease [Methanothermobacter sp.]MDX9693937.1 energy-coupling factor ABC transporter permease [Methanothermobacter sp.]BDH78713.1 cobalamin biosynthesis protein CobM [Methanothermobacter tenebrarum]HHW16566.1 cobalamin biosynthesis protein CobM [Methanothermobacter sp.]
MHIPDGIIPLWQSAIYWTLALINLGIFFYIFSHKTDKEMRIVATGLFAAAAVAVSSISIPSPFGVPVHFFLIPLAVIILGPLTAVLVATLCLIIQFFILGMGGITSMGANILTMGIGLGIGTFAVYRIIRELDISLAVFSATFLGIMVATTVHIMVLFAAGVASAEMLMATLIPFYIFVAVIEGVANIFIVSFIGRIKPELITMDKV